MITRVPEWRSNLHEWARNVTGLPFAWGKTDCGFLARCALVEMFGPEIVPKLPMWEGRMGAARALDRITSPGDLLLGLGARLMTQAFVRTGDIIQFPNDEEETGRFGLYVSIDGRRVVTSTVDKGVTQLILPVKGTGLVYSLWEIA